ncbi:MAG: hypothetical protein QUV35_07070 [Hydrogenophaga sp.]|uniref:hypothetical protein n=1 Tax=Hydrogenophaga sp. TaxID=1904254 RepID=UPI00262A33D6|nr:hypothetical protein [Hydrogenophaga sp.]MDM7942373.1 hypothetical protein [Hydrogenophaga sp.]
MVTPSKPQIRPAVGCCHGHQMMEPVFNELPQGSAIRLGKDFVAQGERDGGGVGTAQCLEKFFEQWID